MKNLFICNIFLSISLLGAISCNTSSALMQSILVDDSPTDDEVVRGLKEALEIGTEKAVSIVSQPEGYLRDQTIKILLPPEVDHAINKLKTAPGGEYLYTSSIEPVMDELIIALNRSASDAATSAAPIFKKAITDMTIQDGWAILRGEYNNAGSHSATAYFEDHTVAPLSALFKPSIKTSLDKPLTGNLSANSIWDKFLTAYNAIQKSPANLLIKLEPVKEPDLPSFVTAKALDGLYLKMAGEEEKIRDNPYQYANDLIEKVFGDRTSRKPLP